MAYHISHLFLSSLSVLTYMHIDESAVGSHSREELRLACLAVRSHRSRRVWSCWRGFSSLLSSEVTSPRLYSTTLSTHFSSDRPLPLSEEPQRSGSVLD